MPKRKNKKAKAAYMRKWRARNKEHLNEWKRKYYKKNKKRIVEQRKAYYQRYKKRLQRSALAYYHKNRESCIARYKKYAQSHRADINDNARKRYYERRGLKVPQKSFSFYRDFIKPATKLPKNERDYIFNAILRLPLTDRQKKLVQLTHQGMKQKDIGKALNISQTMICQIWNGWNKNGIFYGGINKKLLKAINGKRQPKRQISVQDFGSTLSRGVMG